MSLKIDWATYKACLYACKHWHYSKCMPAGKMVKIGVWENDIFIGVVIFSLGATPQIGKPFGLKQQEICELTRVALNKHKTPVSKIVSIAVKWLHKYCPGTKLIISYADKDKIHHGGIYQAMNWHYLGCRGAGSIPGFIVRGKQTHNRTISIWIKGKNRDGLTRLEWLRKYKDPKTQPHITEGKHKYAFSFCPAVTQKLLQLKEPYPKRAVSKDIVAAPDQGVEGGEIPTTALQKCST